MLRMMVCISWLVSLILASPQAIMFRKLKHPSLEFYQCTPDMVIETYSTLVFENGQEQIKFYGINPATLYKLYSASFLFFVYFFPLFCLLISYSIIIILIKRLFLTNLLYSIIAIVYFRREKNMRNMRKDTHTHRHVAKALAKRVHSKNLMQTQWKNLKMSLIHVSFFAISWAPYTIHQAW